jgi:hypothetical protein
MQAGVQPSPLDWVPFTDSPQFFVNRGTNRVYHAEWVMRDGCHVYLVPRTSLKPFYFYLKQL